jgi:hypothetical protein
VRELYSIFPFRSFYVDKDASSPEPCFTYLPESPVEDLSVMVPLVAVPYREMCRVQSLF